MSELDLALPPLHGSADVLHAVCAGLAQVAARLDDTFVAREGREGWGLARAWAGPAFEAARSEAAVTATTIERVARGLEPAAAAVDTYAAALADARRRVLALREEWERGRQEHRRARAEAVSLAEDPVLGVLSSLARLRAADLEWQRLRSELRGRHTGVAERLTASGDQAAVVVRAWFGEGPGADAADAAGMRGALLAELPVTAGTLQRSAARDLIANLITRAGRPVEQWGEPEGDLVASLGDAVRDPLVAQALMERMPPTLLASFVARLRAHIASVSGEGHG